MVYGGTDRELLQVNEESIWYGGTVNRLNPHMKENLPRIREYLEKGEVGRAERLMETAMSGCPDSMRCYQTLGEIQFYFDNMENARERKSGKIGKTVLCQGMEKYERSLWLDRAVAEYGFSSGQTRYHREIFASRPADCIVMRFTADGEGTVDFLARLRRGKFFDGVRKNGDNGILLYGNLGRGGEEFAMALKAKATDGSVSVVGETLQVQGAREVFLYFTADSTYHYSAGERDAFVDRYLYKRMTDVPEEISSWQYRENQYQEALQAMLSEKLEERCRKVMGTEYDRVLEEHIKDYASLYDRFAFTLDGTRELEELPTDERLRRVREGNGDIGLSKLLFDFGRYLTIACSREGGLPATLQGLWNESFAPPWDSKYTININTEMNYWHVESCNLSECHLPLFELLEKVRESGRRTAGEMYGCRGFVAHHNTDIHGDTAPQDIWYPGSYWTLGGAWLCTHLWMHYQYTLDWDFLKKAFPVMAEAALFFVDFLVEKDGYLVTNPSVSPENSYRLPGGETGACCIGATMDNQILRQLFTECLEAWKVLGEKEPEGCCIPGVDSVSGLMDQISYCRERLMPTRISENGTIMEWMEDYEEVDPGHRHISHLYGLYPGEEITVDGTPKLAAAAKKTLERRLANGGGHTGWSRAWITNHYASLWDGEMAYESIVRMLELSTYPNLFDRHPPFQIDGNFGICAAMSRMLVQSSAERVVLLPALPAAWSCGSVRGLCLVGNAQAALSWKQGRLESVEIQAFSDYHTNLIYGEEKREIILKAGGIKTIFY